MVRVAFAGPLAGPASCIAPPKSLCARMGRHGGPQGLQIECAWRRYGYTWLALISVPYQTLMVVPPPAGTHYWHFPALHLHHTMTTAASNASSTRAIAPAQQNAPALATAHSSFTASNCSAVLCGDCCVRAQALSPSIANIFEDFGYDAFAIAHSSFTAFNGSAVLCGDCCESLFFCALERHDTTRHDTTHEMPSTSPSLPSRGALRGCGGTMLISVETSVFACCDLGRSRDRTMLTTPWCAPWLYAAYHPMVRSVVVRCLPPQGALHGGGGMMLTSVETSVFACCDLGRSGLIMAIRCKGQCIWTRTTGTDTEIGPGSPNLELLLVAGCILVGLAAYYARNLVTGSATGCVPTNKIDCQSATTPISPQDQHANAHLPQISQIGPGGTNEPTACCALTYLR